MLSREIVDCPQSSYYLLYNNQWILIWKYDAQKRTAVIKDGEIKMNFVRNNNTPTIFADMKCTAQAFWSDRKIKILEFGWGTKVYVQNQSGPSNGILHRFCLTGGSTLTSQDYDPSSVVYVSKLTRAIWRYLLSEFCALLCCSSSQYQLYRSF